MQKKIGATMLVAGTCIGGGMIALPMVLARVGIIPSIFIMILTWALVYFTAIINLELHLQVGKAVSLGELGKKFSGKIAELIGVSSFKILSYALVSVYIYGGSSLLQSMLELKLAFPVIAAIYSVIACILLMLPLKLIDYLNRILFICLLVVIAALVAGLASEIKWNNLPLFADHYNNISAWEILIPVVFTAFGFQGSLPSIINYCNADQKTLKQVFLWGSFIPAVVYIIWTCSVLGVVHEDNSSFYQQILAGKVEVGGMIAQLSHIAKWHAIQQLVWWISLFAIITSLLGVGIGLCDSLKTKMSPRIFSINSRHLLAPVITLLPAYLVAILIPNAFIAVLGFAGMILVVIAILLPCYLLSKARAPILPELKHGELIGLATLAGIVIIICELINMI